MKKIATMFMLALASLVLLGQDGCDNQTRDVSLDESRLIANRLAHLLTTQPVPMFDYSLQRDVLIQIYRMSNEAQSTYTVVDSITGQTIWSCPSVGFGIPADTSLTNPLVPANRYRDSAIIEQAEPNGLYSSKNTDGTWIVCVTESGALAPIYTEHKVTTFPFAVEWSVEDGWRPVDGNDAPAFTVTVGQEQQQ